MVMSAARLAGTAAPARRTWSGQARWARDIRRTRWTSGHRGHRAELRSVCRRFTDDGDLIGLKLMVLAGLVALTALLERVV